MKRMARNKYVDFVTDDHFRKCVKHVCDAYSKQGETLDMKKLMKHGLDPIKMVFDMINGRIDLSKWLLNEKIRQDDKTINNKVGEFHQMLLGGVVGWTDLGIGDDSHADIKKNDNSIFMEIKNKHNTVTGSSKPGLFDKLLRILVGHPNATVYYAYVIGGRKVKAGERIWNMEGKTANPNLKEIWGNRIYEIVTGDPGALEKVWKALPGAIEDVIGIKSDICEKDKARLVEFFTIAFHTPTEPRLRSRPLK